MIRLGWLLVLTLSGCVGWTSGDPPGLARELETWEPAAVTTASVAFGVKTVLPAWSFAEDEEVQARYAQLANPLFPDLRPVSPATSGMLWPARWPGEHDYAVRIQFQWNGSPAAGPSVADSGLATDAGMAFDTWSARSIDLYRGAGAALTLPKGQSLNLAAGMLGASFLSLGTGTGIALAMTGVGLGLNLVLPHYYEIPVTAVVDVYDRRRHHTTRVVVGVIGNLLVWPPLAFVPIDGTAAWSESIDLVVDWSMRTLADLDLWQAPLPSEWVTVEEAEPLSPVDAARAFSEEDDRYEDNDSLANAAPLERRQLYRSLRIADDEDWYQIDLAAGDEFEAAIAVELPAALDLQLWSDEGRILAWAAETDPPERKQIRYRSLTEQTLYLRVMGVQGDRGNYALEVR